MDKRQAQREYKRLIADALSNPPKRGEKHHIIPRSHGGSNGKDNLVLLSYRDHLMAHWYLWLIHRDKEMAYAFLGMMGKRPTTNKLPESVLAQYERDKKKAAKKTAGRNNPAYGKPRAKGAGKPVRAVTNLETGETWESLVACSKDLGIKKQSLISRIQRKTHNGIWQYA